MTSSTKKEEDLQNNLEIESHYLSQALSKLKPNSSEWSFLQQKLDAVEEAMRNPPPPPPQQSQEQEPSPYVDDSGKRYDVVSGHANNNNNTGGYRDVPFYTDNIPYVDDDDEPYYDDDEPYTQITSDRSALYPSSTHTSYEESQNGNGSPDNNIMRNKISSSSSDNNTLFNPLKKIMTLIVIIMVGILLLFPLLLNKTSKSADTIDNGKKKNPIVITEPCASFSFHLIPDQFGNETSWMIVQYSNGAGGDDATTSISKEIEILRGGPYSYSKEFDKKAGGDHYEMIHATTCLSVGSYAFILYDAKGDGICCAYGSGEYGINLSKGKTIRPLSSGAFVGTEEITPFEVIEEDIDVFPTKTIPEIFESSSESIPQPIDGVLETNDEDEITEPCASFTMHLILDQFGNETTWMIMRFDGIGMATLRDSYDPQLGIAMLDGGPYLYKKDFDWDAIGSHYEMIEATACLPVGLYTFTLYDAKGDGICCEYGRGEYGINLSKGRVIRPLSLGKFSGTAQVTPFQVTTEDIDVLPPISSTTSDTAGLGSDVLASSIDPNNSEAPNNGPCASFSMHLVPDKFGNETTWKLYKWDDVDDDIDITPKADISGPKGEGNSRFLLREIAISRREKESIVDSLVVLEGGPYSYQADFDNEAIGSHYNAIIAETCLPVGSYKFIIYDAEEDGICCEYGRGEYGINLSKGRVIRPLSQGNFQGASQVTMFKVTAEDIDILPPLSSSSTETSSVLNNPPSSYESSPSGANTDTGMMVNTGTQSDTISTFDTVGQKDPYTDIISAAVNNVGTNSVYSPTSVDSPSSVSSLSSLVTVKGEDSTDTRAKAYGILFDIEANPGVSSLVISGMDLYLDTNALTHYEVWSKVGSWQDVNDANPDYFQGFSRVSRGSVTGKGALDFTKIALGDFHDVEISGGQRQAFWVTLSDDNLVFSNFEGEGISRHELASGLVLKANEAMDVFYGAAVRAYPLELADPVTDFWYNAGFLGRLWYKDNSDGKR